jgi:hypothetical protein
MLMRIIVCGNTWKLLENIICYALGCGSGSLADALHYSEPELQYRARFLEDAMEETIAIYKPNWVQISLFD